jgi:hypothetical protein
VSKSRTKKSRSKKKPQRKPGSGSKAAAKRSALEKRQRRRLYAVVLVAALVIATPGAALILGGGPTPDDSADDAQPPEVSGRFLVPYELEDDRAIGRVDIHFSFSVVHVTLAVDESLTQGSIQELINIIDDELVDVVGVNREELIVHVFQGREAGVFTDEVFSDNGSDL